MGGRTMTTNYGEFEIIDNIPRLEVPRGRPPIDNSQLFEIVEEGLKSKEFRSNNHAAEVLCKRFKGVSKDALVKRLYRKH
jgi:hypothetical protein